MKARHDHDHGYHEYIALNNHELIRRLWAIMRSNSKMKDKDFSPQPGFEPWSPGTKSQCAVTLKYIFCITKNTVCLAGITYFRQIQWMTESNISRLKKCDKKKLKILVVFLWSLSNGIKIKITFCVNNYWIFIISNVCFKHCHNMHWNISRMDMSIFNHGINLWQHKTNFISSKFYKG